MTDADTAAERATAALSELGVEEKPAAEAEVREADSPARSEDGAKDGEEAGSEDSKPPNGVAPGEGLALTQRVVGVLLVPYTSL